MSSDIPTRIVVILIPLFLILLSEVQFTTVPAKTLAITAKQREEVEQLRAKLQNAEETAAPAVKGVVVQPIWTNNQGLNPFGLNAKVTVNSQSLKDTKEWRSKINKAVTQHTYAVKVDTDNEKQVKQLEQMYGGSMVGSTAEAAEIHVGDAQAADSGDAANTATDDNERTASGPNTVEASVALDPGIDVRKLQRLELSKRRSKEMLILKSIEEDYSFNLGDDVEEWAHIVHENEEYFIGRRVVDVVIIHKTTAAYEVVKVLPVGQPISYLETYSFWNFEQKRQEGVMLLATGDRVLWYRVNNVTGLIEREWEWVVGRAISGLTYFSSESNEYLAISTNESSRTGLYALNIYQFELLTQEFWIAQQIQLHFPCGEVMLLDTGRDLILALAQNNSAVIYTHNPHADATDHLRFKFLRAIESEGVDRVAGFQMGGHSYVAIGGEQPQILAYQHGDFVPRTMLGNNFGLVELFFPIPARTYRDDLILLVQHRIDFGTHHLLVLETLVWDGEAFEANIPVPCQLGEHTLYGVSCMLDIQRDEGLKGAALLRRGNEISIIVPRHNTESGLFRLHTELLAKNSELLDLQEIFDFLKDWVREQDELVAQANDVLHKLDSGNMQQLQRLDLTELQVLETPEFVFNGEVGEIYINDYKWTDADSHIQLEYVLHMMEQLEKELKSGRQRRSTDMVSLDLLDFDYVEVEDLQVEKVNNHDFYIQDGVLQFDGILRVNDLEVLQNVHSDMSREAEGELVELEGNVQFDKINGIPWTELISNLVFKDQVLELPKLVVNGEVVVEEDLTVTTLNALKFPEDYLLSSGPSISIVTAEKTFIGNLTANAVDTDGLINGVNPFDAISLSDAQDWTGLPTFNNLEVTEILEVNGTVRGQGLDQFPKNPTLQEANIVTANCIFEQLEVHGPVYVQGTFDNMEPLLEDIVQRPANPVNEIVIPSAKTFSEVEFPIDFHIQDNAINGIAVDNFVTLHTKQELDLSVLEAYVYFNNLTISGHYDGVMLDDLVSSAIRIDTPQISPLTQLNFVDVFAATELNVTTTLNGARLIDEFQTIEENLVLPEASFEVLSAKNADVALNVSSNGSALLNGLNLTAFLEKRNWNSAADSGNLYLNELIVQDKLEIERIHGIDMGFLLRFLEQVEDLPEMILDGKVQVNHAIVSGDVQLNKLNGQHFDEEVQLTAVWLNRSNHLSTELHFMQPVEVHSNLKVTGNYNGQHLPTLIDNMVFRTFNDTKLIFAPKSFLSDVIVMSNTNLDAINGVPFNALARRSTLNTFQGSLQISGNVIVHDIDIKGNMNSFPMTELKNRIRYDKQQRTFVVLEPTLLPKRMHLNDLTVLGRLNDIENVNAFFGSLVYKTNVRTLSGKNNFTGRVTIENGADVETLNGNDVRKLLSNIVYISDARPVVVQSPVIFEDSIEATEVYVVDVLSTKNVSGCSLAEWLQEAIRVDQPQNITRPLTFAAGSINGNHINAHYLNDIDLSQLLTKHTVQNLSNNFTFAAVYLDGNIDAGGRVNGVNLQQEFENTLLRHGNQHVSTRLTVPSLRVSRDLRVNALVNGDKRLDQLALLHGNVMFESPLYFQNVTTRSLKTEDLISGIDMDEWFRDALWLSARPEQIITGNWSANTLSIKSTNSIITPSTAMEPTTTPLPIPMSPFISPTYPATLNYMTFDMALYYDYMRTASDTLEWPDLCRQLKKIAAEQGYHLQHLEQKFELDIASETNEVIRKVFPLHAYGKHYLLVNKGCSTLMYRWNSSVSHYESLGFYDTGNVDQVLLLSYGSDGTVLNLVTHRAKHTLMSCSKPAINIWHLSTTGRMVHQQHSDVKVNMLAVADGKLLGIDEQSLKQISTDLLRYEREWSLPGDDHEDYRFVQEKLTLDNILLSNGRLILLLSNNGSQAAGSFMQPSQLRAPNQMSVQLATPRLAAESTLKPNPNLAQKLSSTEIKEIVDHLLSDLMHRLNFEINITQLSIPETDLYDEHLVEDFLAIMQDLHEQQIFPKETFAKFSTHTLDIPGNPAQVLAARITTIIWPSIVEIEELHKRLRITETTEHPVCDCITNSLGALVADVLTLANRRRDDVSGSTLDADMKRLMAVIERVRIFERDIQLLVKELHADIKARLNQSMQEMEFGDESATNVAFERHNTFAMESRQYANETNAFLIFSGTHLPDQHSDEMLALEVGSRHQPRLLYAVTDTKQNENLISETNNGSIRLYANIVTGELFQTIAAQAPHALAGLRIRDESLLAYVDDCCSINMLIYRGVQGFSTFSQFRTDFPVQQLLGLELPHETIVGGSRYFFAVVASHRIIFYEVVVAGLSAVPQLPPECH